jgi:hypothetical protein
MKGQFHYSEYETCTAKTGLKPEKFYFQNKFDDFEGDGRMENLRGKTFLLAI